MPHIPVLLNEVIATLDPKPGENFIDATVNNGGHALAILERVGPDGRVLGIDWDETVIKELQTKIVAENWTNFQAVHGSYTNLIQLATDNHMQPVAGVLFDLGMSNWHIESSGRGFSFLRDEPLDMRYDSNHGQTAAELISDSSEADLECIIREYGEERFAPAIARAIIQQRKEDKITATSQLVEVIKQAVPLWYRHRRTHFATKTFQALRIAVNHEFENIEKGISQAIELVQSGGRIAVITFHSLEDRLVKRLLKTKAEAGLVEVLTKKAIQPTWTEVTSNRKARSAKLRAVMTIPHS